jgi:hypothetical protein
LAADAQEVAVVFEKFFGAGAGDLGQLEFGFLGGAAGLAAFKDILFAGTGRLYHLVTGARSLVNKAVAETHRAVEDDAGLLKGEKIFVTTMRWCETLGIGRMGPMGLIGPICPMGVGRGICRIP